MWRRPYLPIRFQISTSGSTGLNFRVRDENGWVLLSIFTIHGIITDFTDIIKCFTQLFLRGVFSTITAAYLIEKT